MVINAWTGMAIFLVIFSHQTEAQISFMTNNEKSWRWHLTAFCSPAMDAKLCTRSGLANARIQKGHVSVSLTDPQIPESPMTFVGRVSKQNTVHGAVKGLSLHAPTEEKYHGSYNERHMGENCKAEQIILLPSVPDGSVLSLSRVQGICQ